MQHFKKCNGCQDRYVGCHSKCDSYLQAKKKHELDMERKKKEKLCSQGGYTYNAQKFRKEHLWGFK